MSTTMQLTPNTAPTPQRNTPTSPTRTPSLPPEALAALIAGLGMLGGVLLQNTFAEIAVLLFYIAIVAGGIPALPDAWKAIRSFQLDVHVLMLTAAIGAAAIGRPGEGATLLFLFALSGALEAFAMGRTRDAIRKLVGMRPTQARRADGTLVSVESLRKGDVFVVHPAEAFPLDGVVRAGISAVDQSVMTGEAEPVNRTIGDRVVSGTLNLDGILTVEATSTQADSSLERVIHLVEAAQTEKSLASSERLADRVGRYYAPLVLVAGVVLFAVEVGVYHTATQPAIYRALTLLVAASPCALVLSSPAAILSALAAAGRRGLLIRSGSVLETLAQVNAIAFDKTGTLTTGRPSVSSLWSSDGDTDRLLRFAASAEEAAPHPLARALVDAAKERHLELSPTTAYQSLPGRGVTATVKGIVVRAGRPEWLFEACTDDNLLRRIAIARETGHSVVGIVFEKTVGLITFEDTLRVDAADTLTHLKTACGVRDLVLLTGDHERAAEALCGRLPQLTSFRADQRPEDKATYIQQMGHSGKVVAMIGDGVNDAPALSAAAVGITLGGIGSDVALESADMIVMEDRLASVPEAILLARRARQVALQNVVVSLLGVGLLVLAVLTQGVALPIAVICHEGTTVLVVLNGLRLLR